MNYYYNSNNQKPRDYVVLRETRYHLSCIAFYLQVTLLRCIEKVDMNVRVEEIYWKIETIEMECEEKRAGNEGALAEDPTTDATV